MQTHHKRPQRRKHKSGEPPIIWWLIDPFHDDQAFHSQALSVLLPIATALNARVQPVSFLDAFRAKKPAGHRFPLFPIADTSAGDLQSLAQRKLSFLGSKANRQVLLSPIFLTQSTGRAPTLRDKVATVHAAAKRKNVLFVALHSHSHRGMKRLYMGSFAETFLLSARLPMLVINPSSAHPARLRHIVFATDLNRSSFRAFKPTIDLASRLHAKISVIHCHQYPTHLVDLELLEREDRAQRREKVKKGEKFEKIGAEHSVPVKFHMLSGRGVAGPFETITSFTKKHKTDLIALAAESSGLQAALAGSLTRQLVRSSSCPIFVYRP